MSIIQGHAKQGSVRGFYPKVINGSLRFNDNDSAYLSWTPASAGNQKTWTWSGWVKGHFDRASGDMVIFGAGNGAGTYTTELRFQVSSESLYFFTAGTGGTTNLISSSKYRDPSAWYHIVVSVDTTQATASNRIKLYVNGDQITAFSTETYQAQNTNTALNSTELHTIGKMTYAAYYYDGYLAEVHFIDGQALTADDFGELKNGVWVAKDYSGTYGTNGFYLDFSATATQFPITANGSAQHSTAQSKTGASSILLDGNGDYLETPANSEFALGTGDFTIEGWFYHNNSSLPTYEHLWGNYQPSGPGYAGNYALQFNYGSNVAYFYYGNGLSYALSLGSAFTAQTWHHVAIVRSSGTTTLYIDGVSKASTSDSADYKSQQPFCIGNYRDAAEANSFNGYIDEFRISKIARYTSGFTPSTTAFESDSDTLYLVQSDTTNGSTTFTDSSGVPSGLGNEVSGNENHWTTNNIDYTDQVLDSPTNNYATINPLTVRPQNTSTNLLTISDGNLQVNSTQTAWRTASSSIAMNSGKWYFEGKETAFATNHYLMFGITPTSFTNIGHGGQVQDGYMYYAVNGRLYYSLTNIAYGDTYGLGDLIGIAFDADNGTLEFYKNGTSQGQITGIPAGDYYFSVSEYGTATEANVNFGQHGFEQTPPTGYNALITQNLSIADGIGPDTDNLYADNFGIILYTGTGATHNEASLDFTPDMTMVKSRSNTRNWTMYDQVRDYDYFVYPNLTNAEGGPTNYVQRITNGIQLNGSDTNTNASGYTYAAWNWKANGSGVTNTDGSITSTVSANTDAGFSIVSYTGTGSASTVGHGLGTTPEMIIVKRRNTSENWGVYHQAMGATKAMSLDGIGAEDTSYVYWNNTAPTSSVFTVGVWGGSGASGGTYIAYCFAPIEGFSKFGSYVGSGTVDGPFIHTGFKPALVMMKRKDSTGNWIMFDTERADVQGANVNDSSIYPNLTNAEGNSNHLDLLSNGFKLRTIGTDNNAVGGTYIYMAFAENPFKYSNAR